jgi:hypothetical protein
MQTRQGEISPGRPRARTLCPVAMAAAIAVALGATACGGGDGGAGEGTATPGAISQRASASSTIPQPTQAMLAAAGLGNLPVAPRSQRVDMAAPTFSNPTEITNPLFPIGRLRSTIFSGSIDGKPFHTETTLLPETRGIEWRPGEWVETRVSQYFAYIDGRIEEVAIDYYAQADDGSVWYFGEDVFDYSEAGVVDATLGTWIAGRDGPPAMIMPADPKVGDVHRAENIPGVAFEEVSVKTIDKTVNGPTGPVPGAIVGRELHDDGTYSDKVFAPGYGEFYSAHNREFEPIALAVPTDSLSGPPPPELASLSASATRAYGATQSADWRSAASAAARARQAWNGYSRGQVPPRLAAEMERALGDLASAVKAHERTAAAIAAIDLGQSALDFELRYRPPAKIDLGRFELWARQVAVDAAAGSLGGIRGDVATLEWIRDRFESTLEPAQLSGIDAHLAALRDAVSGGNRNLASAADEAALLQRPLDLPAGTKRD